MPCVNRGLNRTSVLAHDGTVGENTAVSSLKIQSLAGPDARELVDELAQIRIRVFREWPYLYDGSLLYERGYLTTYFDCAEALVLVARDNDKIVGASTALPLAAAEPDMQAPFQQAGHPLDEWLYFGESVVLPAYRGQGLGLGFFAERESHALSLGLQHCTFCAVERPAAHPARPAHYIGNERFWENRGYRPLPLQCRYAWPDIGDAQSTNKTMRFWGRTLPSD